MPIPRPTVTAAAAQGPAGQRWSTPRELRKVSSSPSWERPRPGPAQQVQAGGVTTAAGRAGPGQGLGPRGRRRGSGACRGAGGAPVARLLEHPAPEVRVVSAGRGAGSTQVRSRLTNKRR